MEKKKIHPSLPSNYVTLAQLQERWLKQQQQNKIEDDQRQQERHVAVVVSTNVVTVSRSNHRRKIKVVSEERRESENGDGIGDGKMDESKTEKKKNSRRKWKEKEKEKGKGKSKVEEREGRVEVGDKTRMKNANSKTVDEVEEKIRVLSVNYGNEKQIWKLQKKNNGFRESKSESERSHSDLKEKQRSNKGQMIWVRKDRNVGEMDT